MRTNKINYVRQLTEMYQRQTNLRRVYANMAEAEERKLAENIRCLQCGGGTNNETTDLIPGPTAKPTATDYVTHYRVGKDGVRQDIGDWLDNNKGDPALEGFWEMLLDHILTRLTEGGNQCEFSTSNRAAVSILGSCMHEHKRLTMNYTTYDMKRERESLNPTESTVDVMMLSDEMGGSGTPFWYARILKVFHVYASLGTGRESTRLDIVWVRWFTRDKKHNFGLKYCRLERIKFTTEEDGYLPFGFIDPKEIVRAIHLIPAFSLNQTGELLSKSLLARVSKFSKGSEMDYAGYYVNMYFNINL